VVGTGLLALGGFTLSFAALRDLAVRVGMPADLGWIWPLLIDGMIVESTLAVVALSQRGSRRAVWYAWFLLAVGALVSVGSNGAHAVISGHGWAGAAAASVPPVVLLANVRSVGVQGDGRTYGHPIVLRPVSSEDAMTADWTRLPYDVLARISNRITNSVPEVNRVVLDCTSKPPGTIEWE